MDESPPQTTFRSTWRGQSVIKKAPLEWETDESLRREAAILKNLIDPHIVQYYDVEEQPFRLIMEDVQGKRLNMAIPELHWGHKRRIAGEIAHGLAHIHIQGVIHCDIKSANVMLTKKLEAKICDFGSAVFASDKERSKFNGTPTWLSPELRQDRTAYSKSSDIFALGIIMWQMATGSVPTMVDDFWGKKPENIPEDYYAAMQSCLKEDILSRPTARDLSFLKYGPGSAEIERHMLEIRDDIKSGKVISITIPQSPWSDLKIEVDYKKMTRSIQLVDYGPELTLYAVGEITSDEFLLESAKGGEDLLKSAQSLCYYNSRQYGQALDLARQVSCRQAASYVLGEIYTHGHGVVLPNEGEAWRWHLAAAEGGFSRSQIILAKACRQKGHHLEAAAWFFKAAKLGDPEGQYFLGSIIYTGEAGAPPDRKKGTHWMRLPADKGYKLAEESMGVFCAHAKDFSQAMEWFLKAGTPLAHCCIGKMYAFGDYVERNPITALEWLHKAADQKNGEAAFMLGQMHLEGEGVKRDRELAKHFFRCGVEYGDMHSENALAMLLDEEPGNAHESGKLLRAAKIKGNINSIANLIRREFGNDQHQTPTDHIPTHNRRTPLF